MFLPNADREAEIRRWMDSEAQRRLGMSSGGNPLAVLVQQLTQMMGQRRQPTLRDYSGDGVNPYVRQRNPYSF